MCRGPLDALDDGVVSGAPADMARNRIPNGFGTRIGVAIEKRSGRHHHSRSAEAALQTVTFHESLLHRVMLIFALEVLDRAYFVPACHGCQNGARFDGFAVEPHHAYSSIAGVTAPVSARQLELISQKVHE